MYHNSGGSNRQLQKISYLFMDKTYTFLKKQARIDGTTMSKENGNQLELFKISSVSDLTGLSPTVLRAWERRYDFLEPERLPGGHRMYTRDDLRVLFRVKELLDQGHSVGELANQGRPWLLGLSKAHSDSGHWIEQAKRLLPGTLHSHRLDRYRGEGLSVSLRQLAPRDLTTVSLLYDRVSKPYELWRYMDKEARDRALLWEHILRIFSGDLKHRLARLGSGAGLPGKLFQAAFEDAKFGALEPLSVLLREPVEQTDNNLRRAVLLCRDHAKILRNAFFDLDDPLRSADEANKVHGARSLISKLESLPFGLEICPDFEGALTSRCLETSAVDRVLYGLLRKMVALEANQAQLWIGEVDQGMVRFAFHHHKPQAADIADDDLVALATGMSVGLNGQAAIEQGFVGSEPEWVWFHWPVFIPPAHSHICDCEM